MIKQKGNIKAAINSFKNNNLNATSHIFEDATFTDGPLNGATITIKNNIATKGIETNGSSLFLKNFIPTYDSTVFKKIRNSGAAVVAKTHLDEFGMGGTGTYSAYGPIENPLDPTRVIGGSSSGSAATLNEFVTAAIGTDTGDSVRKPASLIGKVGFKPSYGAISRFGLFSYATSLDTVGYLTHNVHDTISMSQILFGIDRNDMTSMDIERPVHKSIKPKRVAFLDMKGTLDDNTKTKYDLLKSKIKSKGIGVSIVEFPNELLRSIPTIYKIISFVEASSNVSNLNGLLFGDTEEGESFSDITIKTRTNKLGKNVIRRITLGSYFAFNENKGRIFDKAQKVKRLIYNEIVRIYDKYDAFIYVSNRPSPKKEIGFFHDWRESVMQMSNFSGAPSITIPWTRVDKHPVNISIEAGPKEDRKLLSHALYIEELLGGKYD